MSESQTQVELAGEAGAEESVSHSLAEMIVDFDISPYLDGPMQEAWTTLQGYPFLLGILLVVFGYLLGRALKWIIHVPLERMHRNRRLEANYQIAHYLTSPIMQTTVACSIVIALALLDFPGAIEHFLVQICFTALLIFWSRAWFRATTFILNSLEADRDRFHMFQPRTVPLYEIGIKLLLAGLFVYLFMLVWDIDATAWFASAGVIGIVVGFAARDTIANLISGVSIVADTPYKMGDYIILDSGERGVVTSLGIRSTRLMTRDDVEVSIPNAVIGAAKIINESGGPYVRHRIRMPVGVAYDSDIDRVIETLESIAADNDQVVDEPAPRVRIRGFGDNAIELELLAWIRRPEDRGRTVHELNYRVIKGFREQGIEIPFPQRDLHYREPRKSADGEKSTDRPV